MREDLVTTTALDTTDALIICAEALAQELNCPYKPRAGRAFPKLFAAHPGVTRALVVQSERLLLAHVGGTTLVYHPNIAYLRMMNVAQGQRDLLLEATGVRAGDRVLDATLGYAAEAILCASVTGDAGMVDGVESVSELGILVRDGLQSVVTHGDLVNAAMRRVRVVHLGGHLEYLKSCPDGFYDIVCFDPFFPTVMEGSEAMMNPLRAFGDVSELTAEAVGEARRVAKRCVTIKSPRRLQDWSRFGDVRIVDSRSGKVVYGVLDGAGSS